MAEFTFDGRPVAVHDGDTLGSALHRAGVRVISRSMKYHRPRGLYCCSGSCASCFVNVDGVPNVPACMAPAAEGMAVRSQNTLGTARRDVLGVVDKVYRRGFDPHASFTRPRIVNAMFLKAVRFMSGVGEVPEEVLAAPEGHRYQIGVDHLVVGGGAQGLRAARRHARKGRATLLVEENAALGGSALWDPTETATRALAREAADWPAVEAWTDALAFGWYDGTVAVRRGADLWEVQAKRVTLAPGRHDSVPSFPGNDLPGILSLRGAKRLLWGHGVLPGRRVAGHGDALPDTFVAALGAAGGEVVAEGQVEAAAGGPSVERVRIGGRWFPCDTVVCHLPGAPRIELFQQAGCPLAFEDGALAPVTNARGAAGPGLFAAFGGRP